MPAKNILESYNLSEEEESKLILREYRSLLTLLQPRIKKADKEILRRAFEMALEAHKDTRRKSGEPYILHPIAVAKIVVAEIGLGVRSSIAGLLHDTVEDTEITLDDIKMEFGSEISNIIDGLTKISHVEETQNTTQQAENFRKVLLTLVDDPRVVLIKIADRLHNMRTMDSMKREKQLKISGETTYIYAPLAHRLGLYEIQSELQDLALKYTEPEVYNNIAEKLKNTQRERDKFIRDFIRPIKQILIEEGFDVEVYGRSKSINSIYNKIKTKGVTFEEVYDLFAIRIIVNSAVDKDVSDCWRIYAILGSLYRTGQGRLRDWLTEPKGNGYKALHNTFIAPNGKFVEVQIRSKQMNEIAEKGIAAHWKYKEGIESKNKNSDKKSTESKLEDFIVHIKDMLKNLDSNSIEGIQDIKRDLFTEEMYVYTPKGDMRVLAVGATAIDFAFDIHSELGRRCIGAKVNYKLVPISHVLKNGDQVEIITSSKQKPHEDWMKFVVTGKARSRIRYYLKEEKRQIADEGKYAIEKKLKALAIPFTTAYIQEIATFFKLSSPLDLFYAVAVEAISIEEFKKFKLVKDKIDFGVEKKLSVNVKELSKEIELGKQLPNKGYELILFGENSNQIKYKLANCCNPINGDDVFGFVTASEGLKIHRTSCPNAPGLMANYGHRIVKAKWAGNKSLSFLTALRIVGLDDVGVINKITNVISGELKINMRSMSLESKDGIFEGTVTVFVHNKDELNTLCTRLESLDGIQKVTRLEIDDE